MSFINTSNLIRGMTPQEMKKVEDIKATINKSNARNASENWRKHIPVYGWTKMNYPTTICPPISEKYLARQKDYHEKENEKILQKESFDLKRKLQLDKMEPLYRPDNKWRLDPDKVNQDVLNEIENLIPVDDTKKFMTNYKKSDLKFFKTMFNEFDRNKKNILLDKQIPTNNNYTIDLWSRKYNFELRNKIAFVKLNTDEHEKKKMFIDQNLFFDKKYCTIYKKSSYLGPEVDKNFARKLKKIGDISFDDDENDLEIVKNLKRLPPDNITEEWIKENLTNNVEILRLDNCYWLSKDLVSKIGRLDNNLKELSLKNLDIDNNILENIIKYTKNLEILDLSNCVTLTAEIGKIIKDNCPNLQTLILTNVNSTDDNTLFHLSQISSLREIDFSLCKLITDVGLKHFAENKRNTLNKIILIGLLKVTNLGLKELIAANIQNLVHLTLSILPQKVVDGCEFMELIAKCKKLQYLDLSGIINTQPGNIESIFAVPHECLTYLNLSGLTQLNDQHIQSIVIQCKILEILRISNCQLLSNNCLDYIWQSENECKIKMIEINRTPLISDAKIDEIIKGSFPNLKVNRGTNMVWSMKNIGYRVPLIAKGFVKKDPKGKKGGAKKSNKKNDDKNPVNQLKKLLEESKPKRIIDLFAVKKAKRGKKVSKKK